MEPEQKPIVIKKLKTLFSGSIRSMADSWRQTRFEGRPWAKKLFVTVMVVMLTCFILMSVGILKLRQGGWIALFLAGVLVTVELLARRHYRKTFLLLHRLDELVNVAEASDSGSPGSPTKEEKVNIKYDPRGKTAILLVNGFNGLGLHTLFSVIRLFGSSFTNFVFIQIGVLDARDFKDSEKASRKKSEVENELDRYVSYMQRHGYYAIGYPSCGTKVVDEIVRITPEVLEQFPNAVFFGGQLVFPKAPFLSGLFHNYTIFAVQKRFYNQGIPIVILPIRVL